MNTIMNIDRSYNGDFGLLPFEIWDIIYSIKDRLEWEDIKKKCKNSTVFEEVRKRNLIIEINELPFFIDIENICLQKAETDFEPLQLEDYIFLDEEDRETYNLNKFYHNILEKNNSTVNKPFRYTNALCYLNDNKRLELDNKNWDFEEQIRLCQESIEYGTITETDFISLMRNY